MKIECGKLYIVTGGSGFLADALVRRIVEAGAQVMICARNEGRLVEMQTKYGQSVKWITGNIADIMTCSRLSAFTEQATGVFHLAAFKHVAAAETQSLEAVRSNVLGTLNVLNAVTWMPDVKFCVGISTDKAIQISGVYGATKFLMEKLFEEYAHVFPSVAFRVVRYGNVIYSTGSVLCKWRDLLKEGREITVTDLEATRFFWTRDQAVDLIFDALSNASDAKPWVPVMKACRIGSLLDAMVRRYAPPGSVPDIKVIGLQRGENMHERIIEGGPLSCDVEQFTSKELDAMV